MTELEAAKGGPVEYRAAQVASVSYPKRTIELVVMPYEQEATVVHQGRLVTEICSRGAWDGVQRKGGKIRVNRDHDITRTCGRAVAFHPSRQEGLVAEIRVSSTLLGDETLALADDDVLDASAGFALLLDNETGRVYEDAEVWETPSRRRLNKLWLGHIALTPDPAYTEARVLAVRTADAELPVPRTPNIDQVRLWQREDAIVLLDV